MLFICNSLNQLSFGKLMAVYEEGNRENAAYFYAGMDKNAALLQAEQDFYAYLEDCFFKIAGAFYGIWIENGEYVSALRMEPYRDGLLLEALETAPAHRRMGFASRLLKVVLTDVSAPVYSHVKKDNVASLRTHAACGFVQINDSADMIDGSISDRHLTLRWDSF